jgi:hypothetical protein
MIAILTGLSILLAVGVVGMLSVYLVLIGRTLRLAGGDDRSHLARTAAGLEAIRANTGSLPAHLAGIRVAMQQMQADLDAVERQLGSVAWLLRGRA